MLVNWSSMFIDLSTLLRLPAVGKATYRQSLHKRLRGTKSCAVNDWMQAFFE